MQRFLSTPPEAEPAPLEAIKRAAGTTPWKASERNPKRRHFGSGASSITSSSSLENPMTRYDAPRTDKGYDSVSLSNGSMSSSLASQGSTASHASWSGRQGRKRHRLSDDSVRKDPRPEYKFACTWCLKPFKRVYEWQRHEESQHAPQTEFVCLKSIPEGKCAFCRFRADPVDMDFDTLRSHYVNRHNAEACLSNSSEKKAFDRKDHLIQHIRQIHARNTFSSVRFELDSKALNDWEQPIQNSVPEQGWTCGFCHENFKVWEERASHVIRHFRSGLDMGSWTLEPNDRGLSRRLRTRCVNVNAFWGCARCLRSFSSLRELIEHEALPHLSRSIWTCADLFTFLASHREILTVFEVAPGLLFRSYILTGGCLMYAEAIGTATALGLRHRHDRVTHWGINHYFGNCTAAFNNREDFEHHIEAVHRRCVN